MKAEKKAALLIYPMFCNYEIALTLALLSAYGKEVVIFAADQSPVPCEEGMRMVPDRTLEEVDVQEFDCLLLSGIGGNPDAVIADERYQRFLKRFAGREDVLIAGISFAPVLLGKAGLLKGRRFCVSMYEEDREEFGFFEYEHQQRAPIVVDGNVITAMGMAFREFAVEVAGKLGYACRKDVFGEIKYPIKPEDYIFRVGQD